VQVSQPRMPCYTAASNLIARHEKLFALSRRSGFYLSVIEEGESQGGDALSGDGISTECQSGCNVCILDHQLSGIGEESVARTGADGGVAVDVLSRPGQVDSS